MLSMEGLKHRYFARISYNGGSYHGWQIQPNAISIQQLFEERISNILKVKVRITGAGRTDTGVHARNYIFHFDFDNSIEDTNKLVFRLNSYLPNDITIHEIWEVPPIAHARFDVISRVYEYHIHVKV